MLAFETNYVVRHLVGDEPRQTKQVAATIAKEAAAGRRILLPDLVLCETLWVLEGIYEATRSDLLASLKALWNEAAFVFEDSDRLQSAINRFEKGRADFSDYLIDEICRTSGRSLQTFGKKLWKEP